LNEERLKRPRDPFQFAKLIGNIATGQVEDVAVPSKADAGKDPAAMAPGRKGVTAKLWEMSDMAKVLEDWEAK
jgi:hypothetical protein